VLDTAVEQRGSGDQAGGAIQPARGSHGRLLRRGTIGSRVYRFARARPARGSTAQRRRSDCDGECAQCGSAELSFREHGINGETVRERMRMNANLSGAASIRVGLRPFADRMLLSAGE
jgi:hypothetical protein